MSIRDIFATKIQERIEAVVKVADRDPAIMYGELKNLIITPQWERYLRNILEEYTEAFDRDNERDIGIWISGFFGSGKSLLMKVLGLLLEGGELQGQTVHELFLSRLEASSTERADLERFLAICQRKITTWLVGGNLHARQARRTDPLALIIFKLFAESRYYTNNWAFAWAVEYQIDMRGLTSDFRNQAMALCKKDWGEITQDSDAYSAFLNEAAAQTLPEVFQGSAHAVAQTVETAFNIGIDPQQLIERLCRWCTTKDKDKGGMRQKLLFQLDELGQWIRGSNDTTGRLMEVQAIVETASRLGQGRIWVAVTAHGDVQELQANVQQALYATINQRFALQCKLTNEDINEVVQKRLLSKTLTAKSELRAFFEQRSSELIELGSLKGTRRVYSPPDEQNFALYYPYFPWTVTAIPNIVKGIAQSTGRDEALTGSNRTMINMVQSGILDTEGLLDAPIGRILALVDLYEKISGDAPIEIKTDINRITVNVPEGNENTANVARVLYLMGRDPNITCNLDNVTRALVSSVDANLSELRVTVKTELKRLIDAGYVKQVGDDYVFLSTQQRSFQRKVREREAKWYEQVYELSQKLKAYDDDIPRFDPVPVRGVSGPGREKPLKIELDNRVVRSSQAAYVTVHMYSPLQYILDPDIQNDVVLKQRSNQAPNGFILRMSDEKEFRRVLAKAVATAEVIEEVTNKAGNDPERIVAEQARKDLEQYKNDVREVLNKAVRGGKIFFRGLPQDLMDGEGASGAVRNTLSYFMPDIYSGFAQFPYRIVNEETAVKAALNHVTTNDDLQKLGAYTNDGSLDMSNILLSTLKGKLPQEENDQGSILADMLRNELERPPFGWDGNAVKVGLALLLRASACRLIIDGKPLTDPHSAQVQLYLTKEPRFKTLRVQGVRSELQPAELIAVRDSLEAIFGIQPSAIAPTLNNELGKQLDDVQKQDRSLREWSSNVSCPLPLAFESGSSFVVELQSNVSVSSRLTLFLSRWETLNQHVQLLEALSRFKTDQSTTYKNIYDFNQSLIHLDPYLLPNEAQTFKKDWETVTKERTVTELSNWDGLSKAYYAAKQAMTNQIAHRRQESTNELSEIETSLRERLSAAGVPPDQIDTEVAKFTMEVQTLRKRLEQSDLGYSEVSRMRSTLSGLRVNLPTRVREASRRYQPEKTPQTLEIRLRWQDILGSVRITSSDDVEQAIITFKQRILEELKQEKIILIE
jgi:hypothetical protein